MWNFSLSGGRVFCLWCRHMGDLISEWLLLRPIFLTPREEQMSFETNSNSQDEEPEESPINWTNKILRPREQDDTLRYCVTRPICWLRLFFTATKFFDTRNLKRLEAGSSQEHEKLFRTWNLMKHFRRNQRKPTKQASAANDHFLESFQIQPPNTILSEICPFQKLLIAT